jgi:hypothetical protein
MDRVFVGGFLEPATWSIYAASAMSGIGSGILWTAQGLFMTLVSTPDNYERDWGLFWALYESRLDQPTNISSLHNNRLEPDFPSK